MQSSAAADIVRVSISFMSGRTQTLDCLPENYPRDLAAAVLRMINFTDDEYHVQFIKAGVTLGDQPLYYYLRGAGFSIDDAGVRHIHLQVIIRRMPCMIITTPVVSDDGVRSGKFQGSGQASWGAVFPPAGHRKLFIFPTGDCRNPISHDLIFPFNLWEFGAFYRADGVEGFDGALYFPPCDAKYMLRVSGLQAEECSFVGPDLNPNGIINRFCCQGVLIGDYMYFVPYRGEQILRVDAALRFEFIDFPHHVGDIAYAMSSPPHGLYMAEACANVNGDWFFPPHSASRVLRIASDGEITACEGDVITNSTTAMYTGGGCLSPDGCIYFAPNEAGRVLRIKPDGIWEFIGQTLPPHAYGCHGLQTSDGSIYFGPNSATNILKITPSGSMYFIDLPWATLSPGKIMDAGIQVDGILYWFPQNMPGVLILCPGDRPEYLRDFQFRGLPLQLFGCKPRLVDDRIIGAPYNFTEFFILQLTPLQLRERRG